MRAEKVMDMLPEEDRGIMGQLIQWARKRLIRANNHENLILQITGPNVKYILQKNRYKVNPESIIDIVNGGIFVLLRNTYL